MSVRQMVRSVAGVMVWETVHAEVVASPSKAILWFWRPWRASPPHSLHHQPTIPIDLLVFGQYIPACSLEVDDNHSDEYLCHLTTANNHLRSRR